MKFFKSINVALWLSGTQGYIPWDLVADWSTKGFIRMNIMRVRIIKSNKSNSLILCFIHEDFPVEFWSRDMSFLSIQIKINCNIIAIVVWIWQNSISTWPDFDVTIRSIKTKRLITFWIRQFWILMYLVASVLVAFSSATQFPWKAKCEKYI